MTPKTGHISRRSGTTFVCELPSALGDVTKLIVKNDRLVAETQSGIPFIVPEVPKDE